MVDSATGRVLARTPIGTPDPAWSVVYSVTTSGGRTTVQAIDPRSGVTLRQTTIDGQYGLASVVPGDLPTGLTADGRTLVLVGTAAAAGSSQFAIVDTALATAPKVIDLSGKVEFDAIGPDAHYLFLIEHIGAAGSGHYQVRAFDLMAGKLVEGAIVDKRDVGEQMNGRPVARAISAGGGTVYTVYVKEDGTAFVHELDTVDGFALCIDLPHDLRAATPALADSWRIATGGDQAFVVNPRLGAALSVGQGNVVTVGEMAVSTGLGSVDAVVDGGGNVVYVGDSNGLTVLPTAMMRATGAARAQVGTGGIALASPGGRLFALDSAGSVVVELGTSGPIAAAARRVDVAAGESGKPGSLRLIGFAGE